MNRMQKQIEEFHRKFAHPVGERPHMSRPELRASLISEEADETVQALLSGDLVGVADGLCDLLYVAIGAAVEMGINLEPLFDEVHRTNMAKEGGGKRADGKTMKPAGWQPPRIAELLREQGWQEATCP